VQWKGRRREEHLTRNLREEWPVNFSFVGVSGYGWSGSGAVVDLLKEVDGFCVPSFEFRLIKDPYGIIDLETFLVQNWEVIRHDTAIHDFLWYCHVLNRKVSKFSGYGLDLGEKLNVDFIAETQTYISNLTKLNYYGKTMVYDYKLSLSAFLINKIMRKLGLRKNNKKMYLSRPGQTEFLIETRRYLFNLFKNYARDNKLRFIVLDQAIPTINIDKAMRYFDEIKLIIVDRDPRDIFVDLVNQKTLIGPELLNEDAAEKYILWHKTLRVNSEYLNNNVKSKNVLRLQFENLVLDYDQCIKEIISFLGTEMNHIDKQLFFKPEESRKNIGLWKNYPHQGQMNQIYKELQSSCFET